MFDGSREILSYSWAQSVFLADRLLGGRNIDRGGPGDAGIAAVTRATTANLGRAAGAVYDAGEMAGNGALDLLARVADDPLYAARLPSALGRRGFIAARTLLSERAVRAAGLELRNKLQVFGWVRNVRRMLGFPDGSRPLLRDRVARAYALDPFVTLWAVEGVGHDYTVDVLACDPQPEGLLTGPEAATVPAEAMTMLHAGLGLAFAERELDRVGGSTPDADVRAAVDRFLDRCRANARAGYLGAALESLGLVARVFRPRGVVPRVDRALSREGAEEAAFFWHGVGRGLYFAAAYFLPVVSSPWDAVLGRDEIPHRLARENAVAGLAWATTMVNLRDPEVIESVVADHGRDLPARAFVNGVGSALLIREDSTPGGAFGDRFCRHRPPDGTDLRWWAAFVGSPCGKVAVANLDALRSAGRLGDLFRYPGPPDGVRSDPAVRPDGPGNSGRTG